MIPRDRVKPRPEKNFIAATTERPVRRHEGELEHILGLLAVPEHMQAEREYASGVTIVNRLEGGSVTGTHLLYERIVGLVLK